MKYKFLINKEVCFWYWAQLLTEWNSYNRLQAPVLNLSLSPEEATALTQFRDFLQEKGRGYIWLWNRFATAAGEARDDSHVIQSIREALSSRFEKLWQEESNKLNEWKTRLEQYPLKSLKDAIQKEDLFFETKTDGEFTIFLNIYFRKYPAGHAKREYPNVILLDVSSVSPEQIKNVESVLLHEITHTIDYKSEKSAIRKMAYAELIKEKAFPKLESSPSYLATEAMVTTFAGAPFSFMLPMDRPVAGGLISQIIFKTSERMVPLTKQYIGGGKELDAEYARALMNNLYIVVMEEISRSNKTLFIKTKLKNFWKKLLGLKKARKK